MNNIPKLKVIFYTNSIASFLTRRDIVFLEEIDPTGLSVSAPVSFDQSFNNGTLSIVLNLGDVYSYFVNNEKDLAYDVYYYGEKIVGIDVYYKELEPLLISDTGDINITLYKPEFLRVDGTVIDTAHPSNFYIEVPYPPITITLYRPLTEYGFVFTISFYAPQIEVEDVSISLYYPQIEFSDVDITLYHPQFIGLQDISLDGEPIPFMYGYEDSLFIDNALILEEYDLTYE